MFQLENLENLQLVLPEDSGEPQIIIPETGIRLTIHQVFKIQLRGIVTLSSEQQYAL